MKKVANGLLFVVCCAFVAKKVRLLIDVFNLPYFSETIAS